MEIKTAGQIETLADFLNMAGPVFDLLPDPIRLADLNGKVHYVNRPFLQMTGFSPTEILNQHIDNIYVEEDRPRVQTTFQLVKKTGTSGQGTVEVRIRRKGGEPIMVSLKAALIRNSAGEPIGGFALFRDVTKIERIISEPLDLLNLTGSPVEILRQLPARVASYFSGRPWVMINLIEGDYLRFAYAVNVPSELMAQGGEPVAESICGIPISTGAFLGIGDMTADARTREEPCVTQYGCRGYLGYPIFHTSGKILGTICIVRSNRGGFGEFDHRILQMFAKRAAMEIERMELETKMAETERELWSLVQFAPVHIWRISPEGRILMMSRKGRRELGYESNESIPHTFFELVHPEDLPKVRLKIEKAAAANPEMELTATSLRLRKHGGDYGNFFTTIRHVCDSKGNLKLLEGVAFEIPVED